MRPTNWVYTAAAEIQDIVGDMDLAPAVEDIIAKHCPFKINTAYMPVPRCDSCKHWHPVVFSNNGRNSQPEGECWYALRAGDVKLWAACDGDVVTQADFGCVQWEART